LNNVVWPASGENQTLVTFVQATNGAGEKWRVVRVKHRMDNLCSRGWNDRTYCDAPFFFLFFPPTTFPALYTIRVPRTATGRGSNELCVCREISIQTFRDFFLNVWSSLRTRGLTKPAKELNQRR